MQADIRAHASRTPFSEPGMVCWWSDIPHGAWSAIKVCAHEVGSRCHFWRMLENGVAACHTQGACTLDVGEGQSHVGRTLRAWRKL